MLILPLSNRISWRNPPLITILIILINTYVLFSIQGDDAEKSMDSAYFYFVSGLAEMEFSSYREYVDIHGTESSQFDARDLDRVDFDKIYEEGVEEARVRDQMILFQYHAEISNNEQFMQELRGEKIITPDDEAYPEWKELRAEYESMQREVVSWKYGFIPAENRWATAFTYMFLHGGFGHLLGNMILLWLVGCILEVGCGRIAYLTIYLVTGLCSAGLFYLFHTGSTVPLVGASGAISGAVAAYTVLFGRRKLKVFYSLGFYFNYTKVPGFMMLPVWIGNEIYQLWAFGEVSNVAYVAHLGGLLSGGLLGLVVVKLLHIVDESVFDETPEDKTSVLLDNAYEFMSQLEPEKARPIVEEVLAMDSQNRGALLLLFNIDKMKPQSEQFHETATRVLTHLSKDGQDYNLLYDTYKEYCRVAKPPRFKPELLYAVASMCIDHKYFETAEQIVRFLVTNQPRYQDVPIALLKLGRGYLNNDERETGIKYLKVLYQRYPKSEEGKTAAQLLRAASAAAASY